VQGSRRGKSLYEYLATRLLAIDRDAGPQDLPTSPLAPRRPARQPNAQGLRRVTPGLRVFGTVARRRRRSHLGSNPSRDPHGTLQVRVDGGVRVDLAATL
jgi:hypothetical protein